MQGIARWRRDLGAFCKQTPGPRPGPQSPKFWGGAQGGHPTVLEALSVILPHSEVPELHS